MSQVLNNVNDTRQAGQTMQPKLISFGTLIATHREKNLARDNQKRSTQVGPVLNGILHSHWDHWEHSGLNE
jgi:hypothetical protein